MDWPPARCQSNARGLELQRTNPSDNLFASLALSHLFAGMCPSRLRQARSTPLPPRAVISKPFRSLLASWAAVFCLGATATLTANERRAIEKELNRNYGTRVVVLRGFPSGESLTYDNDGNLIQGGNPGPWTTDGSVEISRIQLARNRIKITGNRIVLAYQPRQKSFEKLRGDEVDININLASEPANAAEASKSFLKVFLGPSEK